MNITLLSLIEEAKIPPTIHAIARLQHIINKSSNSFRMLTDEIKADAELNARVLRLANSPFYAQGAIEDIEQAIMLIGEDDLAALIISTEVIQAISAQDNRVDMMQFWQENIFSAISAKIIARRIERPKSTLFTAAMLRRIGSLVLWRTYPTESARLQTQQALHSNRKPHVIELLNFGFNHGALTAALLKYWRLPAAIYEPVQHYLEPKMAPADYQGDAAILYLSHQHMHHYFGAVDVDWVDENWIDDILGIPKSALLAEANMEVHAHLSRLQRMLLRDAA